MAAVSKTRASLRIFGDDLDPDEISALLSASPTLSGKNGKLGSINEVSSKLRVPGDGCFELLAVNPATSMASLLNCFRR